MPNQTPMQPTPAGKGRGRPAGMPEQNSAGEGKTPESSLAARVSPGAAVDLQLAELRSRLEGLSGAL